MNADLIHPPPTPPSPPIPIESYTFADCDGLMGDQLEGMVTWRGNGDLSALRGRKISVRIRMARAKLFSVAL